MTESIGKLRELCAKWRKTSITPGRNPAADEVDAIADEIEREIAERYMKLPVDCENKPIHIGDVMDEGKVAKLVISDDGEHSVYVYKLPNVQHEFYCYETAHKPRTIEDVLREFGKAYTYVDGECASTTTLIADYADELRGMGVGE